MRFNGKLMLCVYNLLEKEENENGPPRRSMVKSKLANCSAKKLQTAWQAVVEHLLIRTPFLRWRRDDLSTISKRFYRGQDFSGGHCTSGLGSDRGKPCFVIDFDCKHSRCCFDGCFSLRCSRRSRHALDPDLRPVHIRCEAAVRCEDS